jgi:protein TonB
MFEQALLESARHSPGQQRTTSTAASLLLQTSFLAGSVLVPLLARQVVPDLPRFTMVAPHLQSEAPPVEQPGATGTGVIMAIAPQLVQPSHIRSLGQSDPDQNVTPVSTNDIRGTTGKGFPAIFGNSGPVLPDNAAPKQPLVSVLEQGVVLSRVQPVYPYIAIVNRVQGTVHLNALITSNGELEELHVLSGHPMLAKAALDAVRQWRFRPYLLNGKPIDVQTEVIVKFSLD